MSPFLGEEVVAKKISEFYYGRNLSNHVSGPMCKNVHDIVICHSKISNNPNAHQK